MTVSKKASKKTVSQSAVASDVSGAVSPSEVPTVSQAASPAAATPPATLATQDPGPAAPEVSVIPNPPTDWKPRKLGRGNGAKGKGAQVDNAASAGKELLASTTYVADFGANAPSQARLAHLIVGAAAWRGQWQASKRWTGYAAEENAAWWAAALAGTDLLQPVFDYAVARDPSVATRYPAMTQFMQARSAIATRAGKSRKAKTAAEKAAAVTAEPATAPTQPAMATPAPAKADRVTQ